MPLDPASWGPAVALSFCGLLAIGDTYLHCTEGEGGVYNVHSEAHGLCPSMASLVAEMASGEPKAPSLTL